MSRLLWFALGSVATVATAFGAVLVSVLQDNQSEGGASAEVEGDQEATEPPEDATSHE